MSKVYMLLIAPCTADNCLELLTVDCVPDDMSALAMEIRMDSGLVGTHMYHLKAYKDTVIGKDLVQWMVSQKSMSKMYVILWYAFH